MPEIKLYQIIEEIGRGGMATVYKAWQPSLSREVALKVLPPYFAHDDELLDRFRREALAVAKLRHPNIVQVFDFHQEGDWFYLAMEYISGGSLQARLSADGRLSTAEAVRLTAQVAAGLNHAHEKGFVHRDIKPSNILLSDDGEAVLTDFGIVKAIEGTGRTGTAYGGLGTSEYMSPEQAKGEKVGSSSDLYSLGIVLYEMVTGKSPFGGESPMAVMHSQIYDEPPKPSAGNLDIGEDLEALILKLLSKAPGDRFSTGLEVVDALSSIKVDAAPENAAPDGLQGKPEKGKGGGRKPVRGKAIVSKPTLVRRDTRVAGKGFAGRPAPAPPEPVSGPGASAPRRPKLKAALVVVLVLASAWSGGYLLGRVYLDKKPQAAVAVEGQSKRKPVARKKAAKPAVHKARATETVRETSPAFEATAAADVPPPTVDMTPSAVATAPIEPPPIIPAPAPIQYRKRAPLPKPAPAPAPVPIVVQ